MGLYIFSADVNQDGIVDGTDGALIDNDAFNFATGYVSTDANGDDIVDGSDLALQDNNAFNFVGVRNPIVGELVYGVGAIGNSEQAIVNRQ